MPTIPFTPRTARTAIAVGAAILAILTVLGTAPSPDSAPSVGDLLASQAMGTQTIPTVGDDELTFAQAFAQMREPIPEANGEGQGAVAVAAALPVPEIPGSDGLSGQPVAPMTATAPLPTVTPLRPRLTVRGVDAAALDQITAVEGVSAAAVAEVGAVNLATPGGMQTVTLAAVDPNAFRQMTPSITANESAVWERIEAGDAAFNHDAGNRLTVPLGGTVPVGAPAAGAVPRLGDPATPAGQAAGPELRIGAYASNGIPPVADGLVAADRAAALGLSGEITVYVALDDIAAIGAVTQAIRATVPGGVVEALEEPEQQQAFLTGSDAASFFEAFNYIDHGDGLITIDPGWVSRNIATKKLPIFTGNVTCHRQMLVQLEGALAEVEAAGLAPFIDTTDYGGCWVARHIDWRPDRPISMHGWGLAVDFNVRTNGLGAQPTMDPRIVAIFDRWGFVWGGRWSRPDGMHFELGAVLQAPPQ